MEAVQLEDAEEKELENEFEQKVEQAKLSFIKEKAIKAKEEFQAEDSQNYQVQVKKAENTSLEAMSKEYKIEQKILEEEKEKESEEEKAIEEQIKKEEDKDKALEKAIKEKDLENQFNVEKLDSEEQINEIQKKIHENIQKNREELAKQVIQSKLEHDRRVKKLKGKITMIREVMAEKIDKIAQRPGDMSVCYVGTPDKLKEIRKYCIAKFVSNPENMVECLKLDSFCDVCCEEECSGNDSMERKCKSTKCEVDSDKEEDKVIASSRTWVWKPHNENPSSI